MAVNTPRFGPNLDLDKHRRHMSNFDVEAYRFTDYDRESARYVNLLHLGTDMDAARPEMYRIVQFMIDEGYDVEHEQNLHLLDLGSMIVAGSDTDMLVVGSDAARFKSANYALWCTSTGLFGLVTSWDVLWYGTDYIPDLNLSQTAAPLYSGREFSSDGIFLARSHIRRRDDQLAARGASNTILTELEDHINKLMKKEKAWKMSSAGKFKAFKDKVTNEGHSKPEIELFFAAVDILRDSRNCGAHALAGLPQAEIDKKERLRNRRAAEFSRLAKKHGRPIWLPFVPSSPAGQHAIARWETGLAHMVMAWIDEYSKLPAES